MGKKLTQEEFIIRCVAVHGDMYDYSFAVYTGMHEKVRIICREHGEFQQAPVSHINQKAGCPACYSLRVGRESAYSPVEAARRLKETHPHYDFSKFEYRGSASKSTVVCSKHGDFLSHYESLISGHGCPACGKESSIATRRWSADDVFVQMKNMFPDLDFPHIREDFTSVTDPIRCLCPKHGEFTKAPHKMLSGAQGCPECGKERSISSRVLSRDEVIRRFKDAHGDTYDYSKVEYTTIDVPVTIVCPEHGDFKQIPQVHMTGAGCFLCSLKVKPQCQPKPFSHFLEKARNEHGDTYEYDEGSYSGMSGTIRITCKVHGVFVKSCFDHIYGSGCPACTEHGFKRERPGVFYVYKIEKESGTYAGFGITGNLSLRDAQHQESLRQANANGYVTNVFRFKKGAYAVELENLIKNTFPISSSGVPGFIREAVAWPLHDMLIDASKEFHNQHRRSGFPAV